MADAPAFAAQALTLVWTLTDLGGVPADRITVHALEGSDVSVLRQLETLGVRVTTCRSFHRAHPHCNKLRQLETMQVGQDDSLILCDTDIAFASDASTLTSTRGVRAKIVDLPNPPLDAWREIVRAAGLNSEFPLARTSFGDHLTPAVNFNGGVYVLHGSVVPGLADAWPRWTSWLIERPHLLPGRFQVHVDQVAFGLAMLELQIDHEHLPLADNFPTHSLVDPKPDLSPRVVHYHDNVDASGFLRGVGLSQVDDAIVRINAVIAERRREVFENSSFWDFRYTHSPDLGSGLGSRGASLDYKRGVLAANILPGESVLDVGCGDLEVSRRLDTSAFTGVDVSAEAMALARTKRPDWTFHAGELHALQVEPHDAVVCFDVLIHQRRLSDYRAALGSLVRLARRTLIVSGYNQPPWHRSEITFYHEPLTQSLARVVGSAAIEVVGGYRDTTIVRVTPGLSSSHPIRRALLEAREHVTDLGRFLSIPGDLISTQFETFGGHTRNELAMLLSFVNEGDVIVDAGAHLGSFAIPLARRAGPRGLVVCIEPDAANIELLHQNIVRNDLADRIRIEEAVAADSAIAMRAVSDDSNTGATHFVHDDSGGTHRTVTVDELVARCISPRSVAVLKIDVEGHELSVLRSAEATLARDRPIVYCEVVESQLARQRASGKDIEVCLARHGYLLFRNAGERNSNHDRFQIVRLGSLTEGGPFFDCLAVPAEREAGLIARGLLPAR